MNRPTCPFLGLKDDPTTALSFPSEGNHCHHARPVSPVNRGYQQKYCLTPDHRACPLYLAAHPVPMPPAIAEPVQAAPPSRQMALLMALPLLIAGIVVAVLLLNALRDGNPLPDVIPDTGPQINNDWLFGGTGVQTDTPFPPSLQGVPVPEEKGACPLPAGWTTYVVNPTDSLYRLSVIYGVSVEQLQSINCLGNSTAILPGDIIYVPYVPTNTPVPGLLSTATLVQRTIRPPVIQPGQPQPTLAGGGQPQSNPTVTPLPSLTARPTSTIPGTVVAPTFIFLPTSTLPLFPTSTFAPTNTPVRPTSTVARPTSTVVRPTSTPPPTNTATPQPTKTKRPSRTPKPVNTNTPVPTNTFPATNTPEPTFTAQPINTIEPLPTDPLPTIPAPTDPVPTLDPLPTEQPLNVVNPISQTISALITTISDTFTTLLSE